MKLAIPLLFITILFACTKTENEKIVKFYANVAQAIITPTEETYLIEPRGSKSTGTHDELYVKALALGDGEDVFIIVSFDLVGFDDLMVRSIQKAIFDSTGIKAEQLMLNATHTHNSPITLNAMDPLPEEMDEGQSKRNLQWEKQLIATTATTVKNALGNLKEVSITQGKHPVQIGFNRRLSLTHRTAMSPNPSGPALKETDVLFIKDNESEIAILYSYAAHPVSVHSTSTEFSADFPGYASQYIKSKYQNSVPIFLQGCAGNINSTLRGGFEAAKKDGNKLGTAVLRSSENSKMINPTSIHYLQRNFYLPYLDIDIDIAQSIIDRIDESYKTVKEEDSDLIQNRTQMDFINWAKRLKYIAENNNSLPGLQFHAKAVALGKSLAILSFPDEVFVEYAVYIKEHSPFDQTIVLAYTDGCKSYIPSAEAFYLGGYEPGYAQVVYGQPYLRPSCEKIIKDESIKLLNELWQKY